MQWPLPQEVASIAQIPGQQRTLSAYVRPGMGHGEPLTTVPQGELGRWWPADGELFARGALTVLWIEASPDGLATWAGSDAPWRADTTLPYESAVLDNDYAIYAPALALRTLSESLELEPVPALLVLDPALDGRTVSKLLAALQRAGVSADTVVSTRGTPPRNGSIEPEFEVLPMRPDAPIACRLAPTATWGELATVLHGETCRKAWVRP